MVSLTDQNGKPVPVKLSSWRAGGVQLALVGDVITKELGRWSSNAFMHYSFASRADLRGAVGSMWRACGASPSSLVVGSFAPSGLFEDSPN